MFQTIKGIHSLFDYIIPKEKNIRNSQSSQPGQNPRATRYTQQYPFQPNELVPLQGWLLRISRGEKDMRAEMESLLKVPASSPAACCLGRLGSPGKKKGSVWPRVRLLNESGARAALALGVPTEFAKSGRGDFYSKKFEHRACLCLFLG